MNVLYGVVEKIGDGTGIKQTLKALTGSLVK
jgi:hypothetical protein